MTTRNRYRRFISSRNALASLAAVLLSLYAYDAQAYQFGYCNGVPNFPKYYPMSTYINACSIPVATTSRDAALHALSEWNTITTTNSYAYSGDSGGCSITHGDGQNDMAIVPRAAIGGNNGLTISYRDACTSSSQIVEADMMVANDLTMDNPYDSFMGSNFNCAGNPATSPPQNGSCDRGLGNFAFLHEAGHARGQQHEIGFVVMHNGPPVPYAGGYGNGNPAALTLLSQNDSAIGHGMP